MRTSLVPNTCMLTSSFRTIRKDELNYISELKTAYMNGRFWKNRLLYAYMYSYYWPLQ